MESENLKNDKHECMTMKSHAIQDLLKYVIINNKFKLNFRFPNGFDNDDEGIHASLLRYLQAELGGCLYKFSKINFFNVFFKSDFLLFRSIYGSRLVRP